MEALRFRNRVLKKENESSSMFKENKMTWKREEKFVVDFVARKEKGWKGKQNELGCSLKREL